MRKVDPLMKRLELYHNLAFAIDETLADDLCDRVAAEVEVEMFLDSILGFLGDDRFLPVFKRVCTKYIEVYPATIEAYVLAWKEMWDAEEKGNAQGSVPIE